MKLLPKKEILPTLKELFEKAEESIKISSPWIKSDILEKLLPNKKLKLELVIRSSEFEDFLITDKNIFKLIKDINGKIYLNPSIHSKFVIIDNKNAVVGSANITGSGLYEDGNIETAVLIEEKDQIRKLVSQFEQIKKSSLSIFEDIAGIVLSSSSSITAQALLFNDIPQQTYIKIPLQEGFLLGRVANIKKINDSLLSTFDNFVAKSIFSQTEKLKSIITEKDPTFQKALLLSYLNEKNNSIKVGEIEILAHFNPENVKKEEAILKTPMISPQPGSVIYTLKKEKEIADTMQINHAGYPMGKPVKFGKLFNTNLNAYIDIQKIYTMHMAVLGTTGSGKTTFLRRILENLEPENMQIFIFDLYDEYEKSVKNCEKVQFPSILFPVNFDQIKEIFKQYGIYFQEKSSEEKRVASFLRKELKPDLEIIGYRKKSLEELIIQSIELTDLKGELRSELNLFLEMLSKDFPQEALRSHPEVVKLIKESLSKNKKTVIYDFHQIEDPITRVNIAGLLMKEIFRVAKTDRYPRIIILEEAQNFAPEKGFGEVQSGSSNIAYLMAKKIATEGRKFNLGLIAVTQRPANISKYVLSQLNTQAVFKLINKNDLEAVSVFFEYSKEDIFGLLPFLKPGTGFLTGLAVPFGILTEIKLG